MDADGRDGGDPTLTLKNLTMEIAEIPDWYSVGIQLEVPDHILDQIEANYRGDANRCKTEMLKWWLKNVSAASWVKLVEAVKGMHQHGILVQRIQQKYVLSAYIGKLKAQDSHIQALQEQLRNKEEKLAEKTSEIEELKQQLQEVQEKLKQYEAEDLTKRKLQLLWRKCKDMPIKGRIYSSALNGNTAYFMVQVETGDGFPICYEGKIYAYDLEKDEWSHLSDCPQYSSGLVVIDGQLTAVGGITSGMQTSTDKILTLHESKWVEIFPALPTKQNKYPLTLLFKHYLLVVACEESLLAVMDTKTREWYPSLRLPTYSTSAAVRGEDLYICNISRKTVFKASLETVIQSCQTGANRGLWCRIADIPHESAKLATYCKQLVCVGGHQTDNIYVYDAPRDSWQMMSQTPFVTKKDMANIRTVLEGSTPCLLIVVSHSYGCEFYLATDA